MKEQQDLVRCDALEWLHEKLGDEVCSKMSMDPDKMKEMELQIKWIVIAL